MNNHSISSSIVFLLGAGFNCDAAAEADTLRYNVGEIVRCLDYFPTSLRVLIFTQILPILLFL